MYVLMLCVLGLLEALVIYSLKFYCVSELSLNELGFEY